MSDRLPSQAALEAAREWLQADCDEDRCVEVVFRGADESEGTYPVGQVAISLARLLERQHRATAGLCAARADELYQEATKAMRDFKARGKTGRPFDVAQVQQQCDRMHGTMCRDIRDSPPPPPEE